MLIDMLNSVIEGELAKEPKAAKAKARKKFVDPLARFPLGKQEIADREEDSHIGKMLTRHSWRWYWRWNRKQRRPASPWK